MIGERGGNDCVNLRDDEESDEDASQDSFDYSKLSDGDDNDEGDEGEDGGSYCGEFREDGRFVREDER